jgi:hypothetical protein
MPVLRYGSISSITIASLDEIPFVSAQSGFFPVQMENPKQYPLM